MSVGYQDWLSHVFDREVTSPEWYFSEESTELPVPAQAIVSYVARLLNECGTELQRFSDGQVCQGLKYIFDNGCSDTVFALKDESVPWAERQWAIASMSKLYSDCFESRCAPVLGHCNERGNALNSVCYMLWDVTPLAWWENSQDRRQTYETVVAVLSGALTSPNIACVESALHGLGHIHSNAIDLVEAEISAFLSRTSNKDQRILEYAKNALRGNVL
jgi:hypothetical protein